MEKNMKNMYTYVYLSHFAVQQKLTQHCTSTRLQLKKKKAGQAGPGLQETSETLAVAPNGSECQKHSLIYTSHCYQNVNS